MIRFTSFQYAPAHLRSLLRDRLRHQLRVVPPIIPGFRRISPCLIKQCCACYAQCGLHMAVIGIERRQRTKQPRTPDEPPFEDLVAMGWIRRCWGRARASLDAFVAARTTNAAGLKELLTRRHDREGELRRYVCGSHQLLGDAAAEIAAGKREPGTSRLFDAKLGGGRKGLLGLSEKKSADIVADFLRDWVDRWKALSFSRSHHIQGLGAG